MTDPFADERLPDLPNAGYATAREKRLSDEMMDFIRQIERDRMRLLHVVLEGKETWRRIGGNVLAALKVDEDALDAMYAYFVLMAAPPVFQSMLLKAQKNPQKTRDIYKQLWPLLEIQRQRLQLERKWAP